MNFSENKNNNVIDSAAAIIKMPVAKELDEAVYDEMYTVETKILLGTLNRPCQRYVS